MLLLIGCVVRCSKAFTEEDWKLVQLVLTLFRNILAIQDFSILQKVGESTSQFLSLRDRFLELLFHENVMDIVIVITQNVDSCSHLRKDSLLLLEIFHYIFMGQDPELLANAHLKQSKVSEHPIFLPLVDYFFVFFFEQQKIQFFICRS